MKFFFTLFIIIFFNFLAKAQLIGNAFHEKIGFNEYKSQPQNWDIVQDSRGVIYVANTNCVLEYDSQNWRKINLDNDNPAFVVVKDKNDVIFVGGMGNFGYLKINEQGEKVYESISSKLDSIKLKRIPNINEILINDNKIFLEGESNIYFLEPYINGVFEINNKTLATFKIILENKKISGLYKVNKSIYAALSSGLYIFRKDSFVLESYGDLFSKKQIKGIIPLENGKLLIAKNNNLIIFNPKAKTKKKAIIPFENNATDFFENNEILNIEIINEKYISIGSSKKGNIVMNLKGQVVDIFNEDNVLNNNHIHAQYYKNNLNWYALNIGIGKVDIDSPFRYWDKSNNLEGPVLSIQILDSILYIGNFMGYEYLDLRNLNQTETPNFKTNYNVGSIFCMEKANINGEKMLLLSGKEGIFYIKNNKVSTITKEFPYVEIIKSKIYDNRFYIGGHNNIAVLEYKNNQWKTKIITNTEGIIIKILENLNGDIWGTTYFNGIYFLKNKQKPNLKISEQYELQHFDSLKGFGNKKMNQCKIYEIDDEIFLTSRNGFYKLNEKNFSVRSTNKFTTYYGDEHHIIFTLYFEKKGNIWCGGNILLKKQKDGTYFLDTLLTRSLPDKMISSIYPFSDSLILMGATKKLLSYNYNKDKRNFKTYKTLIRKVYNKDTTYFYGTNYKKKNDSIFVLSQKQSKELMPKIDYENNNIVVEYVAVKFTNKDKIQYQYKLEGFEKEWSDWTNEIKKEYTNLYEGDYTFKVKAKDVLKNESTVASYKFKIYPPLQRTILAYFVYFIFAVLVIFIFVKIYTRRLKKQNIKLENIVKERTKEITKQNEQIMGKNVELEQQKEEILTQAEELQEVNVELEKLSIVASETDNAVLIFDENFDLEWVNYGFTKIYGYSFEEFTRNKKINLIKNSNNLEIKNLINNCIEKKQSVIYETKNITKSKYEIWLQTTLTPIFDEENNLLKLIAIETDISEIKDAHNKISLQNEMITSSITYAQTIQKAILPIDLEMKKHFDFFNIFRPKDIVSGDFYWFTKLKIENKFFIFVAVVDCTGHGVPGAFMSMIGSRLLSEIVKERKIIDTAKILELLDDGIKKSLKQAQTENNDGMDLCLCRFEKMENENINVNFSGAKRPLFIYRDENNEIETIKPDRRSIGGKTKKRRTVDFTNQEFFIKNEDIIYLTTDGYIDQNNLERKRFGTKQFLEITKKIARKNLKKQKEIFEKELNNWMKIEKQRDDITVMAIKMKNS